VAGAGSGSVSTFGWQVEQVEEWKVELVVSDELIRAVVVALKESHPYETPAYEVWRLEDF
jgi:hypothetical protein